MVTHPAEEAHDGLRLPDKLVEVKTASCERHAKGARAAALLHVHATFLPIFSFFAFLPSFLPAFRPSFCVSVNSSSTCSTYRELRTPRCSGRLPATPADLTRVHDEGRSQRPAGGCRTTVTCASWSLPPSFTSALTAFSLLLQLGFGHPRRGAAGGLRCGAPDFTHNVPNECVCARVCVYRP